MMRPVRPLRSRLTALSITASVAGSSLEVASSRMTTSGSRMYALAKASSWASPADRFAFAPSICVSSPSGSASYQFARPNSRMAFTIRSSSISGLNSAKLSRTEP